MSRVPLEVSPAMYITSGAMLLPNQKDRAYCKTASTAQELDLFVELVEDLLVFLAVPGQLDDWKDSLDHLLGFLVFGCGYQGAEVPEGRAEVSHCPDQR